MRLPAIFRIFPVLITVGLWGCAATESYESDKAPEYVVVKEYASFYQDGPLQDRGPDLSLRINDRVKLLKKDFTGFAVVEISDGRQGYVGFEDLAPAPPPPPEVVQEASRSSGRRSSGSEAAYNGPQMNDVPLPDTSAPPPDLNVGPEEIPTTPTLIDAEPATNSKPKFRY